MQKLAEESRMETVRLHEQTRIELAKIDAEREAARHAEREAVRVADMGKYGLIYNLAQGILPHD